MLVVPIAKSSRNSTKPRGSDPGGTASSPAPFTVGWFESEWNFFAPFALQHFSSLGVSLHTHPAGMLSEFSIYLERGEYFIALSLVLFLSLSPQFPPPTLLGKGLPTQLSEGM